MHVMATLTSTADMVPITLNVSLSHLTMNLSKVTFPKHQALSTIRRVPAPRCSQSYSQFLHGTDHPKTLESSSKSLSINVQPHFIESRVPHPVYQENVYETPPLG